MLHRYHASHDLNKRTNMKKLIQFNLSLALIATLSFTGCGGGGSDAGTTPATSTATDITVERGKVYDATVTDSSTPVQTAIQRAGLNIYRFTSAPKYPIFATGGWIDVNGNGIKDSNDTHLDIILKSHSNIITPVTTYIDDENKTIREAKLTALRESLNAGGVGSDANLSDEDLLGVPSESSNLDFVLLTNAIYKDMKEHGGNLNNSDDNSILSQFGSIEGYGTTPEEIEAAVLADLNNSGFAGYISTSEIDDENTTNPDNNTTNPNDTNTTSSQGIYVAESNETVKSIYKLIGSPLLHGSKAYMRLYRAVNMDGLDVGMKVLSYDLSQFNSDINISDLSTNILYNQVGPNYTTANFNQRYYDIAEVNNQLYFSTMPESIDTLSQSSLIKHDLSTQTEVFHVKSDPIKGENLNITFDLARGWFIPFSSNNYMGIVEDAVVKVIDATSGASYKYSNLYDYYGRGATSGAYTDGIPPVATDSGFFSALSGSLYNVSFISNDTSYGDRNTATDSEYIVNDVFSDFNATYSGSKPYRRVSQIATLVLDGENIYALCSIEYDDNDGFSYYDLYLLTYGTDSTLKSATYLDGSSTIGSWFDVFETYKYKDSLYFKFRHDQKIELCSYNLTNKSFTFRHEIGNHPRVEDIQATSYVITGDTIIMPENIKRADYDAQNNTESTFFYDLVFQVIDINTGTVLKTLHHKDLDGLRYSDDDVRVRASLCDANAVYFFGLRQTKTAIHNMIIKLDTPNNSVQKTRNRFDNHLTGVIR